MTPITKCLECPLAANDKVLQNQGTEGAAGAREDLWCDRGAWGLRLLPTGQTTRSRVIYNYRYYRNGT